MKPDVTQEKRLHPRFAVLSAAMLINEQGASGHCLVEDLSYGGARIVCTQGITSLMIGEHVRLLMRLPGRLPFSLSGRVVHRFGTDAQGTSSAFGLAFKKNIPLGSSDVDDMLHVLEQHEHQRYTAASLVISSSVASGLALVRDLLAVGHDAIAVTTSLDAIEWLLDGSGHFDAAFVDTSATSLQQLDGRELLHFLADEYPNVRRILVKNMLQYNKSELALPAHVVLPKPWSTTQLAALFEQQG